MLAATHYLATKPSGLVTVWLIVAIVLFAIGAVLAWVGYGTTANAPTRAWWPAFLLGGLIAVTLAFLT